MIEDIVLKIEESRLIKDELILNILNNHQNEKYFSLSKFFTSIENDIKNTIESLAEKYAKIGETMLT